MNSGLLDLGGLTDAQLRRAGLAIGGLLAGGRDRTDALHEIVTLRAEQTAATERADERLASRAMTIANTIEACGSGAAFDLPVILRQLAHAIRDAALPGGRFEAGRGR